MSILGQIISTTFASSSAPITSQTFSYTGAIQNFTVPTGVTSINVKMWGAGGGGSTYTSAGGGGGYATSTLSVTPGQQYQVLVGGGGLATTFGTLSGGFGGGGDANRAASGGGRSALMTATGDPLFSNVQALLHLDGVNNSIAYADSSNSKRAIANTSPAKQSTTEKKFGPSSAYFDGNPAAINISNTDSGLNLTGDFTVEAWVFLPSIGTTRAIIGFVGSTNTRALVVRSSGVLGQSNTTNSSGSLVYDFSGTTALTSNTWHHVVWERVGSTQRLYLNGVIEATRTSSTQFLSPGGVNIGCIDNSSRSPFLGYIDEVRVTVGAFRYNGAFTPPTQPFPSSFYQDILTAGGGGGAGTLGGSSSSASGGAGGGSTGESSTSIIAPGTGGTQTVGGAGGGTPENGYNGQSGNQYTGGSGNSFYLSLFSGGGGGGGYYGGGGGGNDFSPDSAGGGGGGAGFGPAGVTLIAGSGTTPGNSSDPIRNGAGVGGAASGSGSAPGSSSNGTNGLVYISW